MKAGPGCWSVALPRTSNPDGLYPPVEAVGAVRERTNAGPLTTGTRLNRPAYTVGKVLRRLACSR